MPRKRKNISIEEVKKIANTFLGSRGDNRAQRQGAAWLLECILMEAGAYKGYNFTEWLDEGGNQRWREAGSLEGEQMDFVSDDSRRIYF